MTDTFVLRKMLTFNLQIYALQRDERDTKGLFQGVKADHESVRLLIDNELHVYNLQYIL